MYIKNYKIISFCLVAFIFLVVPVVGFSAVTGNSAPVTITATIPPPYKGSTTLMGLITDILEKIVMPIAAVAVVLWIIWAGFQFVMAQGNPGAVDKAKQNLLWSLVGAGILLGSVAISKVLTATINALIVP